MAFHRFADRVHFSDPGLWGLGLVCLIISGGGTALAPLIVAWALNDGLLSEAVDLTVLSLGVGGAIVCYLMVYYAEAGSSVVAVRIGERSAARFREAAFRSLSRADLGHLAARQSGSFASTVVNDASAVASIPTVVLKQVLGSLMTAAAFVASMLVLSPVLTLLALGISLPLAFLMKGQMAKSELRSLELYSTHERLLARVTQSLSLEHATLMRINGAEERSAKEFSKANGDARDAEIRHASVGVWVMAGIGALLAAGPILLYWIVGLADSPLFRALPAGSLLMFTALQARLPFSVMSLLSTVLSVQGVRAVSRRVRLEVRDAEMSELVRSEPLWQVLDDPSLAIRFSEVGIVHHEPSGPIMSGFSADISVGELVVLRGRSGIGKTSLLRVLAGLELPATGTVVINKKTIDSSDFVTQSSYFFTGTIRENLSLFASARHKEVDDDDIWAALSLVQMSDRMRTLPDGLDTLMGEGGVRLSGGEAQRMAIARAVLRDADLILLDESTSALDRETEELVLSELLSVWSQKTVIVVSHRTMPLPSKAREILLA